MYSGSDIGKRLASLNSSVPNMLEYDVLENSSVPSTPSPAKDALSARYDSESPGSPNEAQTFVESGESGEMTSSWTQMDRHTVLKRSSSPVWFRVRLLINIFFISCFFGILGWSAILVLLHWECRVPGYSLPLTTEALTTILENKFSSSLTNFQE